MSNAASPERREFKAEVQKLLNIITHSIYTNREIFLRELISNSSDALEKLRFESARGAEIAAPELPLDIQLTIDKDKNVLTILDSGVGMTHDELVENIGTIAKSGSEAFMQRLAEEGKPADAKEGEAKAKDADGVIGRFGVGFYSVFMVADQVRVFTKSYAKDAPGSVWISDGLGGYEIRPAAEGDPLPERGARIEIRIKEDAKEFLEKSRLESIIKKHSNFIAFPILLDGDKVNTVTALWREPKFSVLKQQYDEFYKFLTYDADEPLETIHVSVDAPVQFTSLGFIPKHGRDLFGFNRDEYGLDLYVRRVLIQKQNKDVIPEFLSFLRGVVDSEDLPLNLSRETLQENLVIRKISQTLTKQVLSHLEKMAQSDTEKYTEFWRAHAKVFKLGYNDYANREKFAPLLRFNASTHEDAQGLTSLDDYIARAKPDQKEIYFILGQSREAVKLSPHLEIFRKKGVEVLYLYEPMDELMMDAVREYKEFTMTSVEHADMSKLDALPDSGEKAEAAAPLSEDDSSAFDKLLTAVKDILGERVTDVRVSSRLSDSPCCLVSPEGGLTSSMQKILQIVSKDTSIPKKVLELNRDHALIRNLLRVYKTDPADPYLTTAVEQLFESSLLMDGYLSDPHQMVQRMNKLLQQSSDWYLEIKKG
jgi:molecular chaperone HtpG